MEGLSGRVDNFLFSCEHSLRLVRLGFELIMARRQYKKTLYGNESGAIHRTNVENYREAQMAYETARKERGLSLEQKFKSTKTDKSNENKCLLIYV